MVGNYKMANRKRTPTKLNNTRQMNPIFITIIWNNWSPQLSQLINMYFPISYDSIAVKYCFLSDLLCPHIFMSLVCKNGILYTKLCTFSPNSVYFLQIIAISMQYLWSLSQGIGMLLNLLMREFIYVPTHKEKGDPKEIKQNSNIREATYVNII